MFEGLLSKVDYKRKGNEDMLYLKQLRGAGTGWVFRMRTPPELVGLPNPWDGEPLRKTITKGLGTRHLPTARKRRDIVLGDIRRLKTSLGDEAAFSLAAASEWRDALQAARTKVQEDGDPFNVGIEFVLYDRLEEAEARGVPTDKLKRFARVAKGTGFLLEIARDQFVDAGRAGNTF